MKGGSSACFGDAVEADGTLLATDTFFCWAATFPAAFPKRLTPPANSAAAALAFGTFDGAETSSSPVNAKLLLLCKSFSRRDFRASRARFSIPVNVSSAVLTHMV